MNLIHLHLLLNHVPTVGTVIALGLFLVSLVGKSDDLKRASLAVFFGIALLSLPTYMTGNAAQAAIKGRQGVSEDLVETHRDAALPALVLMEITGLVAWLGLWQFRRISRPTRWNLSAVLLLSVVTLVLMARAADIGGDIRHPEIASGTVGSEWIKSASIASFVLGRPWVWPASETLHFIGLALLLGVVLVVNLRMLGIGKNLPFAALHRMLPLGILGFGINSMTGMLFFIATPGQYTQNVAFFWKIVLVMLAGVNLLYLTMFDEPWALGPGDDAPLTSKVIAASAIFLWVGVIYCGRMLPFIGNSF
ncbi:MAG: hypothetical protein DMG12_19455 [Acidobacteria bacterium]|nr:MAG: hypothetical protein DMG12_19455 [Acidobacteriota bacterium]